MPTSLYWVPVNIQRIVLATVKSLSSKELTVYFEIYLMPVCIKKQYRQYKEVCYEVQKVCCRNSEKGGRVRMDLRLDLGYFKKGMVQAIHLFLMYR